MRPHAITPTRFLASALLGIVLSGTAQVRAQDVPVDAQLVEKGRMVAIAADCAACHTAPDGGKPFAGNYALQSPLGAIVSTNITPSRQFGIGSYTEEDLARAVREGRRKDGAHLYPAMPYDAYTLMTDGDLHALYTYLMHGVKPVEEPTRQTELPFPFSQRWSMMFWNALFLNNKRFQPDEKQTPEWNRGAYLTEALAHCATCHTPRNQLMGAVGNKYLAGSSLGAWYAPNITSDPVSGIGHWTVDEIVQYLRTGKLDGKAQAAGGMAEAVDNSFQYLPESDLHAIAVYLKSVPPIRDAADAAHGDEGAAADQHGKPHSDEAMLRGARPQNSTDRLRSGEDLFSGYCASCHQASGSGTPDQAYPSLFQNSATGLSRPDNLIAAILFGVERNAGGKQVLMPRFDEKSYVDPLSNDEIAAITNHVLKFYGPPTARAVTPADVQRARDGGEQPLLAKTQPYILPAMMAALALVVAFIVWLIARRRSRRRAWH